jgi:hypothetical protein
MSDARKRKYGAVALLLLLLLIIAGWRWSRRPEAPLARALALRDRVTGADSARLSPEERRRQWRQLREAAEQLTPADRKAFWAERRRQFRDWLDDFFRAPRREQIARLDEEIDRMNAFRREATDSASGQGPGWTAGLSEEELLRRQKLWLDLTTAEERALVDQYFAMLEQQRQQRGQSADFSPWGNEPT